MSESSPLFLRVVSLAGLTCALWCSVAQGDARVAVPQAGELRLIEDSTHKVVQLTGDFDFGWRMPTLTQTGVRDGLYFTDLGVPFEHRGRLGFAFGDSISSLAEPRSADFIAYAEGESNRARLSLFTAPDGTPVRIDVPGIRESDYEVPSSVISLGGRLLMVFTTDSDGFGPDAVTQMRRSVMAVSEDDGRTWSNAYTVSQAEGDDFTSARFINVSMVRPGRALAPEQLPAVARNNPVLLWGTGEYRRSQAYLAVANGDHLHERKRFHYFAGFGLKGQPTWSLRESEAQALFTDGYVGEVSAIDIEEADRFAVAYATENPDPSDRGVYVRFAQAPWGPYEPAQRAFDPWQDRGYTEFMHVNDAFGRLDNAHDPGREFDWGGEYGAFLIDRWTSFADGRLELTYTMSTWNPYQVVLMRSSFAAPSPLAPKPPTKVMSMPGDPSWTRLTEGATFTRGLDASGQPHVVFATGPDFGERTAMWRDVPADPSITRIEFEVWAGDAEVVLIEGGKPFPHSIADATVFYHALKAGEYGRVVRAAAGLRDTRFRRQAIWALAPYDRAALRLVAIDPWREAWGGGRLSAVTFTNDAQDRWADLRGAALDRAGLYPAHPAGQARAPFDHEAWSSHGDADAFILERKYGRRYVSSLNEAGFEASGAVALTLPTPPRDAMIEFELAGGGGEAILLEADEQTVSALAAARVVSDLPTAGSVCERVVAGAGWMPGQRISWRLSSGAADGYVLLITDAPGANERFVSISEPRVRWARSGEASHVTEPEPPLTDRLFAAGSHDWHFSSRDACGFFFEDDSAWVTTFGPRGDADRVALWRNLPPMSTPEVGEVRFQLAGTGGAVYLLAGEGPPLPLDRDPAQLHAEIAAGRYGDVLHRASGQESVVPIHVRWPTKGQLTRGARVVIIDDSVSPWGFLTVSDFRLVAQ